MNDGLLPTDPSSYFTEIENAFCARRNAPLLLSPLDFEKIAGWYDAKIPVEVIINGINRYFEKLEKRKTPLRRAICLSFAEDQVLKCLEEFRQSRIGAAAGLADTDDGARKKKFLVYLEEKIESAISNEEIAGNYKNSFALLKAVLTVVGGLKSKESASLVDIENKLSPFDLELGITLLSETPEDLKEKWRAESRQKMKRAGLNPGRDIHEATERRIVTGKIFSRLKIPRLSILYYDE